MPTTYGLKSNGTMVSATVWHAECTAVEHWGHPVPQIPLLQIQHRTSWHHSQTPPASLQRGNKNSTAVQSISSYSTNAQPTPTTIPTWNFNASPLPAPCPSQPQSHLQQPPLQRPCIANERRLWNQAMLDPLPMKKHISAIPCSPLHLLSAYVPWCTGKGCSCGEAWHGVRS